MLVSVVAEYVSFDNEKCSIFGKEKPHTGCSFSLRICFLYKNNEWMTFAALALWIRDGHCMGSCKTKIFYNRTCNIQKEILKCYFHRFSSIKLQYTLYMYDAPGFDVTLGISIIIIHQIFSLARDWSKRVTWANIPQLKMGNI